MSALATFSEAFGAKVGYELAELNPDTPYYQVFPTQDGHMKLVGAVRIHSPADGLLCSPQCVTQTQGEHSAEYHHAAWIRYNQHETVPGLYMTLAGHRRGLLPQYFMLVNEATLRLLNLINAIVCEACDPERWQQEMLTRTQPALPLPELIMV